MSRWPLRTFWRFSFPGSQLWTWGRPTPTSAWLWPASSPSLTAPLPASSVHRPTVSTAFAPSQHHSQYFTLGEKNAHTPSPHLPTTCNIFVWCLVSFHTFEHTYVSAVHASRCCSDNRCTAYQHIETHLLLKHCCTPQLNMRPSRMPTVVHNKFHLV